MLEQLKFLRDVLDKANSKGVFSLAESGQIVNTLIELNKTITELQQQIKELSSKKDSPIPSKK